MIFLTILNVTKLQTFCLPFNYDKVLKNVLCSDDTRFDKFVYELVFTALSKLKCSTGLGGTIIYVSIFYRNVLPSDEFYSFLSCYSAHI